VRQAGGGQFRFECVRRIGRSALGRRTIADRRRRTGVASTRTSARSSTTWEGTEVGSRNDP
jgi:hypothetical protein